MVKFQQVASFARASFNRQAIILLEALGVSKSIMLDMFRAEKHVIEATGDIFLRRYVATLSMASSIITVDIPG